MTEEELKGLAAQLRQPSGEMGVQVADFMNDGNVLLNRNTINAIPLQPGEFVVEIGMGNGKLIPELLDLKDDLKYAGCDFSELMVQHAGDNNAELVSARQVSFYHTQASELPFQMAEVDHIFTVNTLYFWEDQNAILEEFKRVLKPGGTVTIGIRPKERMQHYGFVKYGFNMFNPNDVVDLLTSSGFLNVSYEITEEPDYVTDDFTFKVESLVVRGVRP